MVIAIALNEDNLDAIVPPTLEEAKGLWLLESDTLEHIKFIADNWVDAMDAACCEALICGDMTDPQLFEGIADICVTRYHAGGRKAAQAIEDMKAFRLRIITDYVGGTGCGGHDHKAGTNCCHGHHE